MSERYLPVVAGVAVVGARVLRLLFICPVLLTGAGILPGMITLKTAAERPRQARA